MKKSAAELATSTAAAHRAWIGVDLDGTLAYYDRWRGPDHIGPPVAPMLYRVRAWLAEGRRVKLVTARAGVAACRPAIQRWLVQHDLAGLEITSAKDFEMVELWDDRVVQVVPNTGERAGCEQTVPP